MATNTTMTIRIDADLKRQAEEICNDMGLTMSAAITIFTKRLVADRAIPFRVTAGDHFYSDENMHHLKAAAKRMDSGNYITHSLIEEDK
ncbi:MAG: type II toxin-antitoxin system RelB/DinJ family antitoxin [Megasphaera sp.]|jgi:DNA-damage-inducible protein J|nr:type II toxin-antitoxin system RelB/DinJ family antitoxin [Megasphaera sp.]MCI1247700.1 type II toxin-antitoxin system RelB/DinJ family antitoxin [Megasphaera sp.]